MLCGSLPNRELRKSLRPTIEPGRPHHGQHQKPQGDRSSSPPLCRYCCLDRRSPARHDQCGRRPPKKAKSLPVKPGSHTSFGPLKQIEAGLLNVGYAEAGPAEGPPVLLCTDGPMTLTASSMSRRCWRRRAIGDSAVSTRLRNDTVSLRRDVP